MTNRMAKALISLDALPFGAASKCRACIVGTGVVWRIANSRVGGGQQLTSLADFDGSVLVNGERITALDGLHKLVAEQVDGNHPPAVPDVVDNQSASRDAVNMRGEQHGLESYAEVIHAH